MNVRFSIIVAVSVLCAFGAAWSVAGRAQPSSSLAMLDELQGGDWELRSRDQGGQPRRICMHDARRLIQLRHPGESCSRIVVEDTPEQVTVQYTCPGRGYGRTQIRRETEALLQIDSQGIAQGRPFAFAIEARRLGACAS